MSSRPDRIAELLPEAGIDLLLITNLVNLRYLTGYTGSNGLAVIGPETRLFLTDFRYLEQASEEVDPAFDRRRSSQDLLDGIEEALPPGDVRLGFEAPHVSVSQHRRLREGLPERAELVATNGLVEGVRAIKQPEELEAIKAAAELADEAFEQLVSEGLIGHSERDLALRLEYGMRRRGAQRPSFEPIVAAGPHAALPHATPRDVEVRAGDLVVIDWGAELDGYCSDCTRTLAAAEADEEARAAYELVLEAQLAGLAAVTPGALGRDVDAVARGLIVAGGHGEHFGHGLGHGVGLEVHEAPRLAQRSESRLRTGNVLTVEPGVYLPGQFGVRIEDLVVVVAQGREILTSVPKELTLID